MGEISRRTFLGTATAASAAQPQDRPNVLFLMTDQQRFDALGANSNQVIQTPNLDKLAARSARFIHTFVQSPVCVPSRVSYFTGRYAHCHRNRVNYTPCKPDEVFWQKLMRDAGYRTSSIGKLHYYPATAEHARSTGWDEVMLDDGVTMTDRYSDYMRWLKPLSNIHYNTTKKGAKNPFEGELPYELTPTWWTGTETCRILREQSSQPFFVFSSFFKPHSPYTVPTPFANQYNDADIPLPRAASYEEIQALPKHVRQQILRGRPVYNMDRERLQWIYRSYYGAVSMVDDQIGRILQTLEATGKADNTIIIFASDHGDQLLEHGLEGKNVFFEGSVRVPLMICWPKKLPAGVYDQLTESIDVLPTILDWCGVAVPKNIQGRRIGSEEREIAFSENVMPEVITGGSLNLPFVPGKGVFEVRHPDAKMARTKRWKLNYYPGEPGELYDLQNDPGEFRNLFSEPERRGIVSDLKAAILDWMITADENDQIAERWMI